MATPTWDQLLQPILELACREPITRQSAKAHVYDVVPMTKEEKEERLKSGNLKVGNRVGWAMSHMTKAKLIEKVEKATYQATAAGNAFLKKHQGEEITYHTPKEIDGYQEAWKSASAKNQKQANKGVFITTSDFVKTAIDYAKSVSQKVILINGPRLADLMIEHSIGVSTVRTVELKRLDSDYFEE